MKIIIATPSDPLQKLARLVGSPRGIAAALVLLTLGVYSPVFESGFVTIDDPLYVTENPMVKQGLTLPGIRWAFQSTSAGNWHPITWLSHMLDCTLFGMDPNGHHVVSTLWHSANAALLFYLLASLTGTRWRSALVAALFAWHPLHVESVAWISERKDVLSTFFGLLAILYYHRYVTLGGRKAYGLSLLLFGVSLMAKPMFVTLPCVLLLLDYWPLERLTWTWRTLAPALPDSVATTGGTGRVALRRAILEKIPFLALSMAVSAVAVWTQRGSAAMASMEAFPLPERIWNSANSYVVYLTQMVWPKNLILPYLSAEPMTAGRLAAVLLILLGVTGIVVVFRARKYLLTGWCFYLGTLVPVIGLVQVGEQSHADRYTYVPLIGVFILLAWGSRELFLRVPRSLAAAGVCWGILLLTCLSLTWHQARVWKTNQTLFAHTLRVAPSNRYAIGELFWGSLRAGDVKRAMLLLQDYNRHAPPGGKTTVFLAQAFEALNQPLAGIRIVEIFGKSNSLTPEMRLLLGNLAESSGDIPRAYAEYGAAQELEETRVKAMLRLGALNAGENALGLAEDLFKQVLAVEHGNLVGMLGLAAVNADQGKLDAAHMYLQRATRSPAFTFDEFYRHAIVQAKLGMTAAAEGNYLRSIERNHLHFDAHYNLGNLYARNGSFTNAVRLLDRAVQLKPWSVDARNNLGVSLASLGAWTEASWQYREAIKVAPSRPDAYYGLARVEEYRTNWGAAATNYSQALKLKPDLQDARLGLAMALNQLERWNEAIPHLELFLQARSASGLGHYQLGISLLQLKRGLAALPHLERAVELRPQDRAAVAALARLLATCPEASGRNGTRAVALAERLGAPPNPASPQLLDTLAAAYAETGAFEKATATSTRAITMAQAAGNTALATQLGRHLELYHQKKPLRE